MTTAPTDRIDALDALRGLAIVWMIGFHLAFDLNHFGWIHPPQQFLSDPMWTWQRVCIVSLFMFCAGTAQAMARTHAVPWSRFWRRWLQVAGCAALVSLATWFVFPASWISFGVLHGLALMVFLARLTARAPSWGLWAAAGAALVLPHLFSHPVFDSRWLNGIGLVTRKPITEDYAPLLPWMGAVWVGMAAGPWLMGRLVDRKMPSALVVLGRWPLTLYMVHQPLFWGILLLVDSTWA